MEDRSFIQQSRARRVIKSYFGSAATECLLFAAGHRIPNPSPLAAGYSAHLLGPSWLYRRIQQIRRKAGMPAAAPSTARHSLFGHATGLHRHQGRSICTRPGADACRVGCRCSEFAAIGHSGVGRAGVSLGGSAIRVRASWGTAEKQEKQPAWHVLRG